MKIFTGRTQGTWMIIDVVEGKDISVFSLNKGESEILLLPNTTCKVTGILQPTMKVLVFEQEDHKYISNPDSIDVISLKQVHTSIEFKLMMKEEENEHPMKLQNHELKQINAKLKQENEGFLFFAILN